MKHTIKHFFKLWSEIWSLPVALILWYYSAPILHWLDPTAATFDAGVLQTVLYAIIALLAGNSFAMLGIKFNFPIIFKYYADEIEHKSKQDFLNLTPWQRIVVTVFIYALYLACFVVLARMA